MNEIALRLAERLFDQRLIENQYRSAFVEAMIEPYLTPFGWCYSGADWAGWDFEHSSGARLELKQSAAQQTWSKLVQIRSRGSFDIAPRTGYYGRLDGKWVPAAGRNAGIYVFAWNGHYGEDTDHRDPRQWEFYVVPRESLPEAQRSLALSRIKTIAGTPSGGASLLTIDGLPKALEAHLRTSVSGIGATPFDTPPTR